MVLGTDLGGGNVNISLVLHVFFEEVCFFMFLLFFLCDLFFVDREQKTKIVVILGGTNVAIMLVLIRFSEMRVLSQVSFLNDF